MSSKYFNYLYKMQIKSLRQMSLKKIWNLTLCRADYLTEGFREFKVFRIINRAINNSRHFL